MQQARRREPGAGGAGSAERRGGASRSPRPPAAAAGAGHGGAAARESPWGFADTRGILCVPFGNTERGCPAPRRAPGSLRLEVWQRRGDIQALWGVLSSPWFLRECFPQGTRAGRESALSSATTRTLKLPAFKSGSSQQQQAPLNSPHITPCAGTKTLRAAVGPGVTSRLGGFCAEVGPGDCSKK